MQIQTNRFQEELKQHGSYSFPFLISYENLAGYETGSFLCHWHPEIELTLVTEGEMIYQVSQLSFRLKKGDALFANSGALHSGRMAGSQNCRYTSVTFDARLVYGQENSIFYTRYIQPVLQDSTFPAVHMDGSESWHASGAGLIRELIRFGTEACEGYELDILSCLSRFWKLLYLCHGRRLPAPPHDRRNEERIRILLSYIKEHYSSELTLDELSGQIHVSRGECCRIFKRYMNQPLFDFILQYRIRQSMNYLGSTGLSVTEIASLSGFQDSNYFARVFRRFAGCSPLHFRKSAGHTPA